MAYRNAPTVTSPGPSVTADVTVKSDIADSLEALQEEGSISLTDFKNTLPNISNEFPDSPIPGIDLRERDGKILNFGPWMDCNALASLAGQLKRSVHNRVPLPGDSDYKGVAI